MHSFRNAKPLIALDYLDTIVTTPKKNIMVICTTKCYNEENVVKV